MYLIVIDGGFAKIYTEDSQEKHNFFGTPYINSIFINKNLVLQVSVPFNILGATVAFFRFGSIPIKPTFIQLCGSSKSA